MMIQGHTAVFFKSCSIVPIAHSFANQNSSTTVALHVNGDNVGSMLGAVQLASGKSPYTVMTLLYHGVAGYIGHCSCVAHHGGQCACGHAQ